MTRRHFLATTLAATPAFAARAATGKAFSFVLLGDLHFDRPEHHDFGWVKQHSPDSVRQSGNYSRITKEIMPQLFATVKAVTAQSQASAAPVRFVLQVGDLVEGLCGSEELAAQQNREALEFVDAAELGVPFLFTKGNQDVTGPGSTEAFAKVFHPFLSAQARRVQPAADEVKSGRYTLEFGDAQFVFFDAYDRESLDWYEAVAQRRTAGQSFVVVHPPVVPYGARSTWYLYSREKDRSQREKLLELLGRQGAIVLGGHIHKFNTLSRRVGSGGFAQLAVSSVISKLPVKPKYELSGVEQYTGDQVKVEPAHSPETENVRRAVYDAERQFVRSFEYADLPGYAVVTVDQDGVRAEIFAGTGRESFRKVDLTALLKQARA